MANRRVLCILLAASCVYAQTAETSNSNPLAEFSMEQLLDVRVETATLKKQSLSDAPADVTVITAMDIQRYGYRTLGEALSNLRGFYSTLDGGFQYSGVRGFSLLGDYNTRFLVMINGHPMTDNVYGAMYLFGQDFGLDMDLVEQIEIVRGPSSALYGSNGVFATINILTKAPGRQAAHKISTEMGSFGETKAMGSAVFQFGRTGRGIVSGSLFHSGGRQVGVTPLQDPTQLLTVDGAGREQGFHSYANLSWNRWNLAAMFGERRVSVPTGFYNADIGDSGTRSLEARNFVELAWRRSLGKSSALKWRGYYDQYRYDGIYNFLKLASYQSFDGATGDWVGSQLLYQREGTKFGSLTLGAETSVDLRNLQYSYNVTYDATGPQREERIYQRHPNAGYAFFVQEEWKPSPAWTIYLGGRLDDSKNNRLLMSPRAAVVYKRNTTAYKFNYGKGFRNPSTYERYYEPNPTLAAERIHSVELSREQTLGRKLTVLTSVFHYRLSGLIQGVNLPDSVFQYQNMSNASATGLEMEVKGQPIDWLQTTAGYTLHRVRGNDAQSRLENSPSQLAHLRAAVPLAKGRLTLAGAMRYTGSRLTAYGESVPGAAVFDLTATAKAIKRFDLQVGVRNLADKRYFDPLSAEHGIGVLRRPGRSVYLKLTWGSE